MPTNKPQMKLGDFFTLTRAARKPRFRSWELRVTKPGDPSVNYVEVNTRKIDAEASKARLVRDGYTVVGPAGSTRSC